MNKKEECETAITNKEGMTIRLIFPAKTESEEEVRQEVKAILTSALQEQLQSYRQAQ